MSDEGQINRVQRAMAEVFRSLANRNMGIFANFENASTRELATELTEALIKHGALLAARPEDAPPSECQIVHTTPNTNTCTTHGTKWQGAIPMRSVMHCPVELRSPQGDAPTGSGASIPDAIRALRERPSVGAAPEDYCGFCGTARDLHSTLPHGFVEKSSSGAAP